jgi:hypothetical protein
VSIGSSQVVVGILDTGVDPGQPDLRGKHVAGYDYVNNDQDPSDDNGHGTAVAGVVAASSDNRIGVAGYCWGCRLMPVKVLGADGTGFASCLAQGIVWATDHGARVINASLGSPVNDLTLAAPAQYAWLRGVLVVAAAGNESSPSPDYPAVLPNVLSVSASDHNDRLYAFSNSGARVAAPGENSTTGLGGTYVSFLGILGRSGRQRNRGARVLARAVSDAGAGRAGDRGERRPDSGSCERAGRCLRRSADSGSCAGSCEYTGRSRPGAARGREERDICRHDEDEGRHRQAQARKERERRPRDRCRPAAGDGEGPQRPRGDQAQAAGGRTRRSLRPRRRRRESARTGARARTYRLVVSTTSRRPVAFALTISYPAADS